MIEGENKSRDLSLPIPKGIRDILPEDQEYITYIKKVVRHRCRQSGYRRISTPYFEFKRNYMIAFGNQYASLKKRLYEFEDKDGNELVLRLEGTVGIARAYISNKMYEWAKPVELYYIEPFFDFVQKSKKQFYRSYLEFGVETMGESDPAIDAQTINMAFTILQDLSIQSIFSLQINNFGCKECLPKYLSDLENFFIGKERALCYNCRDNFHHDLLAIFRCEEEDCKILSQLAPSIEGYYCPDCKEFFELLKSYLSELRINYTVNHKLIGPYNRYNRTIFQFWEIEEKKQNVIINGGRYDYLIEKFGGEPTAAVGFSMRLQKAIKAMKREKVRVPSKDDLHVYIAQLSNEAKKKCLRLITQLRDMGIKTIGNVGKGSIREQIKIAEMFKVPYMLIVGLTEVRENKIILRYMKEGQQKVIPFSSVNQELKKLIGEKNLDLYSPSDLVY